MTRYKLAKVKTYEPKAGLGRAGYANNPCHGKKEDGTTCDRRSLAGGYYCKAHVPKAATYTDLLPKPNLRNAAESGSEESSPQASR